MNWNRFYTNPTYTQLIQVATDPHAEVLALGQVYLHIDKYTGVKRRLLGEALARNPNLAPELHTPLLFAYTRASFQNPTLSLWLLENSAHLTQVLEHGFTYTADQLDMQEWLEWLSRTRLFRKHFPLQMTYQTRYPVRDPGHPKRYWFTLDLAVYKHGLLFAEYWSNNRSRRLQRRQAVYYYRRSGRMRMPWTWTAGYRARVELQGMMDAWQFYKTDEKKIKEAMALVG